MEKKYADFLLKKTKEDYDDIAKSFSLTREYIWEELSIFGDYIKDGDSVLDLGCGNGRLLDLFRGKIVNYIGVDNSERLIEIAINKFSNSNFQFSVKPKFIVADVFRLPFKDGSFNKVFSIAVLHHIPSKEYRTLFLSEIKRVLKPEGILILTTWNLWSVPGKIKTILKYSLLKFLGKSKLDFNDVFIPWQNRILRYVHCFTKKELNGLINNAGFKIIKSGILKRKKSKWSNIFFISQK